MERPFLLLSFVVAVFLLCGRCTERRDFICHLSGGGGGEEAASELAHNVAPSSLPSVGQEGLPFRPNQAALLFFHASANNSARGEFADLS